MGPSGSEGGVQSKLIAVAVAGLLLVPLLPSLLGTGQASVAPDPETAGFDDGSLEQRAQAPGTLDPIAVELKTDGYGVTHLFAPNAYSLIYAQGYVEARDRLFQMDLLRHVAVGDSASVVGESQLASDLQVRRDLYTRDELARQFGQAPTLVQGMYLAYTDGVNRYIEEATATGQLPGEFAAFAHAPEPWTPLDSVAVNAFVMGFFGQFGGHEIENAQMLDALEASLGDQEAWRALADLNWLEVQGSYPTIPATELVVDGGEQVPDRQAVPDEQLDLVHAAREVEPFGIPADVEVPEATTLGLRHAQGILDTFHLGSNALVVSGQNTTTGQPMLLGGPQTGYLKPAIFHQVGFHAPGVEVAGVSLAAVPSLSIGRTATATWSITSGIDDMVDTVALELHPSDDHRYRWDGAWERMACREEVHQVAPSPGKMARNDSATRVVVQEVCRAQGMPVVAWNETARVAWAQRSALRGQELETASTSLPQGMEGWRSFLEGFPANFNFLYAGPDGIAVFHTGEVPTRAPGLDPRLPALAGSAHAWQGEAHTLADVGLTTSNPEQGYLASWNNAPAKGWRAGDIPQHWGTVHRGGFLDEVVQDHLETSDGRLAWQDLADINEAAATHDPFARQTVPHLVEAARSTGDARLAAMADALASWRDAGYPWQDADGDDRYDHPGHAIWDAARKALQDRVFRDELGQTTPEITFDRVGLTDAHAADHGRRDNKDTVLVDALEGRTQHAWCDDVDTPSLETCRDVMIASLADADEQLIDRFGTADVDAWLLPEHKVSFLPMGAGHADTIDMVNRGSWNHIVALGQGLDQAKSVLPPGNSGRITGAELAAMQLGEDEPSRLTSELDLFTGFAYKPFPVTAEEVDEVTVEQRHLVAVGPPTP